MAAKRGRAPVPPAADASRLLTGLPREVLDREILARATCDDAERLALTGDVGAVAAANALQTCTAWRAARAQAKRDLRDYVDLLLAHVARMTADGWRDGWRAGPLAPHAAPIAPNRAWYPYLWAYSITPVATGVAELHLLGAATWNDDAPVIRIGDFDSVREQVNAIVAELRRTSMAVGGGARPTYAIRDRVFRDDDPIVAFARMTSLARVLLYGTRALSDDGSTVDGLAEALEAGAIDGRALVRALAQAVAMSPTLNTGTAAASVSGAEADVRDDAIDVDAVLRATGIADPRAELGWIDAMAGVIALGDAPTLGDAHRVLFTDIGIQWVPETVR